MSSSMIRPDEIDWYLGINEVDTEVANEDWQANLAHLVRRSVDSGGLVYVCDAEGEFVFLATRPMAGFIVTMLNDLPSETLNAPSKAAETIHRRNLDNVLASIKGI